MAPGRGSRRGAAARRARASPVFEDGARSDFATGSSADAWLGRLRVVLVEPSDARNVGAVARLCANYGVVDVIIVARGPTLAPDGDDEALQIPGADSAPWEDEEDGAEHEFDTLGEEAVPASDAGSQRDNEDQRHTAGCSQEIPLTARRVEASSAFNAAFWGRAKPLATEAGMRYLQHFQVVADLGSALEGSSAAVAFTGREGGNFRPTRVESGKLHTLLPPKGRPSDVGDEATPDPNSCSIQDERPAIDAEPIASDREAIASRPLALVFGREATGLAQPELLRCSHCCTLGTHGCTSLNLSHAVGATLSLLFLYRHEASPLLTAATIPMALTSPDGAEPPCATTEAPASVSEVDATLESIRGLVESKGYPVGRTRAERREKLGFRVSKHLANYARVLHRARATPAELEAFVKVATMLAGERRLPASDANPKRQKTPADGASVEVAADGGSDLVTGVGCAAVVDKPSEARDGVPT